MTDVTAAARRRPAARPRRRARVQRLIERGRPGLVDLAGPSSEPFRTLRLALELRRETRTGNTILFTSARAGAGKSTVAANFALVSSLGQTRVLLVDGDLRRPTLHDAFGLPRSPGLVELLAADAKLEDVVKEAHFLGRLDLLPAGRALPGSGDLTSSTRMGEILKQAAKLYDLVVVDSPPLLGAIDAAGLASFDGVDVVFVATRYERRRPLQKALRKLELMGANVAGIVVNREGNLSTYGY